MTRIGKVVGARLRELRELRQLSRDDLAAALHTTVDEIAAYEAGAQIPASCLMQISVSLQVTVQAFFIGPSEEPDDEAPSLGAPSPAEGHNLIKAFVKIQDPRLRAALIEMADYMASPENC